MTMRTIGDFRVRCTIVQENPRQFSVQVCTRKVGGNAPEKCWDVPGLAFDSRAAAEQGSLQVFERINGVRFNGEPEFVHASA
ncbi:MAG TPA: hypothetical protein VGC69_01720 [Bordetella sp.]